VNVEMDWGNQLW